MIDFDRVTITYPDAARPALSDVSLSIPEGEMTLVIGGTGSGKSTLLNCVNGLVPHFTGGTFSGRVTVDGRDTRDHPPRDLADVVGMVRQDPQAGFVTDVVEDELAYTMESLAIEPMVMRRRVEETLDLLGLADLRQRALRTLSGGQRQRVAIGSVLTTHPKVLVLDEPTSALDPQAAEEVLAAIQRLVFDLGLTVLVSEHRLERVVQFADRIVLIGDAGQVSDFADPSEAMLTAPVAPPVVQLGRWAGWRPLPLSVRDARRSAEPLRTRLKDSPAPQDCDGGATASHPQDSSATDQPPVAQLHHVTVRRGDLLALRDVNLAFRPGEIVAVMGRNGAGKSTALATIAGSLVPSSGSAEVLGRDPASLAGTDLLRKVAMVPQEPQLLLWAESIGAECHAADKDARAQPGTARELLDWLLPGLSDQTHPGDLSEGSRLMLVLAIMLSAKPKILLLDEPTRGLDYEAKARLSDRLRKMAKSGVAIILATHDVEIVAGLCSRVALLADGEVVADELARRAVTASPAFAPQVAKILSPLPFLTVAEVRAAAGEAGP
ncbi:MAG: ATP-binding cassette domain-containing protein [Candidatus Nanopelagicales bacterium]|nr:ATP-binding cassette domain-containing protein [Candidatus Nanopelagicales bacterium]